MVWQTDNNSAYSSYVLPGYRYNGLADLQATLEEKVIKPAEEKAKELERK